ERIKPHAEAIYGTRGGPFHNGKWGGASHSGKIIYLFVKEWKGDTLSLGALPQKITAAKKLIDGSEVAFKQSDTAVELTLDPSQRVPFYTVIALTLEQAVADGVVVDGAR
ncbi:MAG: hypothetical protein WCJ66_14720, partial [Verrucomicrobiota bacterium]